MAATVRPITLGRYSDSVDAKDDEVTLLDNKKIYLGTGSDLQLVHDGSNSIINDAGTGNLKLQVGGSDKLEVTSTGISVTGDISATGTIPASVCTNNLIINGAMLVDQRNNGSAYTGGTEYTLDRWAVHNLGTDETPTVIRHSLTSTGDALPWAAGLRQSFHLTNGNQTSTDGGDYMGLRYHIEARDIRNCGWDFKSSSSYITLSFWIKSSVAQNFYGYIRSQDGTAQTIRFETGSLTADTWTKVTKTIPGNSNISIDDNREAGLSLFIHAFWGTNHTDSGASLDTWGAYSASSRTPDYADTWWTTDDATFEVTGVQLELGQVANDFKHESYTEVLAKCQRYFFNITGDQYDSAGILGHALDSEEIRVKVEFPVPMREMPNYTGNAKDAKFKANNTSGVLHWSNLSIINTPTTICPKATMMKFDKGSSLSVTAGECGDMEFHEDGGELQFSAEL
jgi:hypothetical protein